MTEREFHVKIMARLWVHFWKPPDEIVCTQIAKDYYQTFRHISDDRLIAAVDAIIRDWSDQRIPKIAQFFRYIPPISTDRQLPYDDDSKFPRLGPPPGLARYIKIALGRSGRSSAFGRSGRSSAFGRALTHSIRDDAEKLNREPLPHVDGETYMERLANCIDLAKREGAPERTIRIVEGAVMHAQ